MKALTYLITHKLKNNILSVLKKPSQLIMVIIFLALMIFSAFTAQEAHHQGAYRDIHELYAIIFALYSFIFVMISKNGFHNGAAMFSMADVNLIFTSPLNQGKVLSFGLFQQLGRSLMVGFFILYQSATICSTYGVAFSALVYILMGYGVTVFLAQMTSMVIYSYTSSDDKKCNTVKTFYYLVIGAFVVYAFAVSMQNGGITVENLVLVSQSLVAKFFPVSGMISFAVAGAIEKDLMKLGGGLLYCILFWVLYRIAVKLINSDFYEDVLQSAEILYSAIAARKEGKAAENAPRKVKTGKIGFTKGFGASAIAEKHKIENRRSKAFILTPMSLVMVVFSVVASFLFRYEPIGIFAMNTYMLIVSVASGRWAKELSYPYVYLMPQPSHKKLFYMIKSEFPSMILESILCYIPVYFIAYISLLDAVGMAFGRISFGVLFLGVNLLLQRIFGTSDKKFFIFFVYFALIAVFIIPGIFTAILASMYFPFFAGFSYIAMGLTNILIAAILIFCLRNLLESV